MKTLRALGISDSAPYAERLEKHFSYTNTHFHREPRFDLTNPDPAHLGRYDFVVCSDVLEHVRGPVDKAFSTLYALLKPSGFLLVTVPYSLEDSTREHFATLKHIAITTLNGRPVLVGEDTTGTYVVRDDVVFHGGSGETLEMRIFSQSALRAGLTDAGFSEVTILTAGSSDFGVLFNSPCSLPILAIRGALGVPESAVRELVEEFGRNRQVLNAIRESYWVRLGRLLGFGPKLN